MLSQDLIIPNSEASDDEQPIYIHTSADYNREQKLRVEDEHVQGFESKADTDATSANQYTSRHIHRTLRERTAIQKMPYSLDRIRHRQLLQGFDISNFDYLTDTINLPKQRAQEQISKAGDANDETIVFHSSPILGSSISDEYEELDSLPRLQRHHNLHISDGEEEENDETSNFSTTTDNEHVRILSNDMDTIANNTKNADGATSESRIVFRGRQLDLKTGYKGVLPKVAWEKSLLTPQFNSSKNHGSGVETFDRIGLAKRRTIVNRTRKDDSSLIMDFIGDDFIDDASINEAYLKNVADIDTSNTDALRTYFDRKYGENDSLMDENNHEADVIDLENESTESETIGLELLTLNDEDFQLVASIAERDQFESEIKKSRKPFPLRDSNPIDFMLTKNASSKSTVTESKATNTKKSSGNKRNRKNWKTTKVGKFSIKDCPRGFREKRNTSFIDGRNDSTSESLEARSSMDVRGAFTFKGDCDKHRKEVSEAHSEASLDKNAFKKDKTKKNKKSKGLFTVPPSEGSVLKRKAMTFSTVIEQLSNSFAFKNIKGRNTAINVIDEELETTPNIPNSRIIPTDLFEALEGKAVFSAIDVISFEVGGENFTISKLDQDGEKNLRALLEHIVKFGASDEELKKVVKLLTEFLFSWDSSAIFYILNDFHREFRAKANILREKVKPIHFFLLSACQLIFTEICRYNSTSLDLNKQILDTITSNISSYFKLMAKCHVQFLTCKDSLMVEALSILEFVIQFTDTNEMLWEKLSKNRYPPKCALTIAATFPTKTKNWRIASTPKNYDDVAAWFQFIELCRDDPFEWTLDDNVIVDLYEFFKNRRFEDFEEELHLSDYPIVPTLKPALRPTLFNSFLVVLSYSSSRTSLLEKMTPLSKVHDLSSVSLFVNRLNLLLVLASKADYSFERKIEDLFNQYFSEKDFMINKLISIAMLKGLLYFFQLSKRNRIQIRGQVIVSLWKETSKNRRLEIDEEWYQFWDTLRSLLPSHEKSRSSLLKGLHQILHSMVFYGNCLSQYSILFDIYMENLSVMKIEWIKSHLMQLILIKAKTNMLFLRHYCEIVKFLVERNALTWWSLFSFNTFTENDNFSLNYYTFLVENCDVETFKQVRLMLYQRTIKFLLYYQSLFFVDFLRALADKDPNFKIRLPTNTYQVSYFKLNKNFLMALREYDNVSIFTFYLDELKDLYLKNSSVHINIERIVRFLNRSMIDIVRLLPSFIFLRSVFDINSEASEHSALREHIKSLANDQDRLLYLIERLIPSIQNASNIYLIPETLVMTIEERCFEDEIGIFCCAIVAIMNYCSTGGNKIELFICFALLSALNSFLDHHGCFIIPENFQKLIYVASQLSTNTALSNVSSLKWILNEYHHFFYNVLRLGHSFYDIFDMKDVIISNIIDKTPSKPMNFKWAPDESFFLFQRSLNELLFKTTRDFDQNIGIIGECQNIKGREYITFIIDEFCNTK